MLFTPTDERLSQIETSADRPFSEPTIKFDGSMLTVQLESWYWALRRAVINAVDTKDKVATVVQHLQSGDYARMNSGLQAAQSERTATEEGLVRLYGAPLLALVLKRSSAA